MLNVTIHLFDNRYLNNGLWVQDIVLTDRGRIQFVTGFVSVKRVSVSAYLQNRPKRTALNSHNYNYVLKLSIQMFLWSVQIQQLTHSFERQDIALKALIIRDRWSKKKTPIVKVLGIVCELLVNNVSALMAAKLTGIRGATRTLD